MKILIRFILIFLLFNSFSVDEFLDAKPTGALIPETVEGFDKLLESPVTSCETFRYLTFMGPDVYFTDKKCLMIYG